METKIFEKLGRAFSDGMKSFFCFSSYESGLFLTRRLAGVPGYQYRLDASKEYYQRQIFTCEELLKLKVDFQNVKGFEYRRGLVFDEKWHLIDIKKVEEPEDSKEHDESYNNLLKTLEFDNLSKLEVTTIEDEDFKNYLNDEKFKFLSRFDQFVMWLVVKTENADNFFIKFILKFSTSVIMIAMKIIEIRSKKHIK